MWTVNEVRSPTLIKENPFPPRVLVNRQNLLRPLHRIRPLTPLPTVA